ncbi:MAG: hypothetical protein VST72_07895 [Nitrospirota bacterium]|nr:hypothetical protein [Nitrospirota bacterium]
MSVFEAIMLICFGAAWPVSIYKSYVSRTTAGKSVIFLYVIFTGYISGLIHKLVYNPDIVIYLYAINGLLVFTDILLYHRNRRLESRAILSADRG